LLGNFIQGLNLEIRCEVKAFKPCSMTTNISYTQLQEEKKIKDEKSRTNKGFNKQSIGGIVFSGSFNLNRNPPTKHLTQEELKERTSKGICWHCDDIWHRGHRCK
ncbi:hypothetical protein CFOL_v3_25835, partial [Cephalotus follicularis]